MKNNIIKPILFTLAMSLLMTPSFSQVPEGPKISKSVFFGRSKPIREAKIVLPGTHEGEQHVVRNHMPYGTEEMKAQAGPADKPALQKTQGNIQNRGPVLNYEGIGNVNGIMVADPNGEVGPDHYIQTVNSSFAVWDKEGDLIYGPVDNKTLWESFPGPWEDLFWGDPVFKYDHMANRWVISSMSISFTGQGPNYEMVAVSVTPDPLGAYYCYAFEFEYINDYPKLSIWPDGYYITYNMYDAPDPDAFAYSLVTVIDREAMLAGEPEITMIQFEIPDPDTERFFPMAADLRGENLSENEPCCIITVDNHVPGSPWELSLDIYEFQTDWQDPSNSQFGITAQFDLGAFEPLVYYGPGMEAADGMILYINKDPEVYAGPDVTIDSGEPLTLQGEVDFAYEYFWTTFGDGGFTDSTMLDAIYTFGPEDIINRKVVLVLTAKEVSPCTGSIHDSLTVFIVFAGLDDLSINGLSFNVYPNPTSDNITIKANTPANEQLTINILGSGGKVIFSGRFHAMNNPFEIQFDLSLLKPGIYFVRLQAGDAAITRKVVVM